jgi:hypothetical protein
MGGQMQVRTRSLATTADLPPVVGASDAGRGHHLGSIDRNSGGVLADRSDAHAERVRS